MDSDDAHWERFKQSVDSLDKGDVSFAREVFTRAFGRLPRWNTEMLEPDEGYGQLYVYCVRCDAGIMVTDEGSQLTAQAGEQRCRGVYFMSTVCGRCEWGTVKRDLETESVRYCPSEGTELSWSMLEGWTPFVNVAETGSRLGSTVQLAKRVIRRQTMFAVGRQFAGLRMRSVRTGRRDKGEEALVVLDCVQFGWA